MKENKTVHHYLFSVGIHGPMHEKSGQLFIKHGVIHWTNKLHGKIMDAKLLNKDRLFPGGITYDEALEIEGVTKEEKGLINSINPFFIAARVNMCTVHKFTSESEVEEEWFDHLVEYSHRIKSFKKLLKDSKI